MAPRIVFLGNQKRDWCTEVHYSRSFRSLGCEVLFLQEDMTSIPEIIGHGSNADLLVFMRTTGTLDLQLGRAWEEIEQNGCRTATISLDLYQGLAREPMVHRDYPAWATQWVFTADGDPAAEEMFVERGIRHVWLPPAVYGPEAHPGVWDPRFDYDVVFVGSHPSGYHGEWTWRPELLAALEERYGMSYALFGKGGAPVIRGEALNNLYATARCAVGDSLCPMVDTPTGPRRKRNYWSDRIVESVGRGAVVVFPDVPGLAETYGLIDGEHCWFYQYGDVAGLYERVDWCILNPAEARTMALAGQAQLRDGGHTYADRARTILQTVGLGAEIASPTPS